jgi:hypothetical protein
MGKFCLSGRLPINYSEHGMAVARQATGGLCRTWHRLTPETRQITGDETLYSNPALSLRAPTVINTRWSIRSPAISTPKLREAVSPKREFTGAEMQKLHLKVRNLPIRNLQMWLPGVSCPAIPPLAPSAFLSALF